MREVKKDSLIKHINSKMHQEAWKLQKKEELGPTKFVEVVEKTLIGKGLSRMNEKDREALSIHFNSAYYFGKWERPFTDYPILLNLQEKNGVKKINESYRTD